MVSVLFFILFFGPVSQWWTLWDGKTGAQWTSCCSPVGCLGFVALRVSTSMFIVFFFEYSYRRRVRDEGPVG